MPRANPVPSYCLHKPSGLAVVKFTDKAAGKRRSVYLGPYGSDASKEAYARVIAALLTGRPVEPVPPSSPNPRPITVRELGKRYLDYARRYYRKGDSPTSEVYVIRSSIAALVESYGGLPAADFGVTDLKAVRERICGTGVARSTVNRYVQQIRRAFRWASVEGLIPPQTAHSLSMLPGLRKGRTTAPESAGIKPVSAEIVRATCSCLRPVTAAMVQLQQATGMRPSEVCAIRPIDVDKTGDVWAYTPQSHKTEHLERRRTVYIGPRGQLILRPWLGGRDLDYCFPPERVYAAPRTERRYSVGGYRRAISRAAARAGVEAWSPNQLRHSFATEARRRFGLEAAQVVLGHSKASTAEIYAERDAEKAIGVVRAIG